MLNLQSVQDSALPRRGIRGVLAVVGGLVAGLLGSPVAHLGMAWVVVTLVLIGAIVVTVRHRHRGIRGNSHAPMKPDAVTPTWRRGAWVGGSRRDGGSPWSSAIVVIASYVVPVVGGALRDSPWGWVWAAVTALTVGTCLMTWLLRDNQAPFNYVPLRLLSESTRWNPDSDAQALAGVLYAILAVPGGRQITRDALADTVPRHLDMDSDGVHRSLRELNAQGIVAVVPERDRTGRLISWVSLTEDGEKLVTDHLAGT